MILAVQIQPNARKSEILGLLNGALKIRIKAPPIDGKANEEVISFLSQELGIPKKYLSIKSGQTSKKKLIEIAPSYASAVQDFLNRF